MVSVTGTAALAIAAGAVLGLGLWLLAASVPRLGRPRLMQRVAPYLADVSDEARASLVRRTADPAPVLGVVAVPLARRARALLGQLLGGDEVVRRRLRQAGSAGDADRFRGEQLAWSVGAFCVASVVMVVAPAAQSLPVPARVMVPVLAAVLGATLRDWLLQRAARRRLERISAELPTVLEFLTLSLTAGEGILDAIRRVARTGHGELAAEFAGVVAAVGAGVPLPVALRRLRDELGHPAVARALDQVIGALDRGAPLASVLAAQAGDAREAAKRTIIELAGRKEIAMLVPLIFLILPITIAFALFPGYVVLQAGL
ncbi:type II secretion system F family protein [Agromyces silvae]|uniref:type II secretion system F family protein n=1 Tax=Agromyces silvae TaxID=3388266 RepID=UPI00280A843F|nr:type II secretion system F family protein [Agromyces protaetiae]